MKKLVCVFFILLLPTLNACVFLPIKHKRAISPKIEGVVVDAVTGKPIAGAKITLLPPTHNPEEKKIFEASLENKVAHSSENGIFKFDPIHETGHWFRIVLLPIEGHCMAALNVESDGYAALKQDASYFTSAAFNGSCSDRRVVTVDVELEPTNCTLNVK